MRRPPVPALAPALLAALLLGAAPAAAAPVLVVGDGGRVSVREDRFLPAAPAADLAMGGTVLPAPPATLSPDLPPGPARAAAARRTVPRELRRLGARRAISRALARSSVAAWSRARARLKRLRGAPRAQLRSVLANAEDLARSGRLSAARVRPVMLTVRRNAQWWNLRRPLGAGQRVTFRGSRLIWQFYPGQGIQIQWLATFGKMNALATDPKFGPPLEAMAREVSSYATPRAGGVAWEYLFRFGGGRPPWVSGMAQGTAIQALARAAQMRRRPALLATGRRALGIFRTAPPQGVRVRAGSAVHYLGYSYAPGQRIFNQFFQALIGLHDFAQIAGDASARRLFLEGERRARTEVVQADTGRWSLYQPGQLSDLGYHKLLRDFVRGLCERLQEDRDRETELLREREGPEAVLDRWDDFPDASPYCHAYLDFNAYLYRSRGRTPPYGG